MQTVKFEVSIVVEETNLTKQELAENLKTNLGWAIEAAYDEGNMSLVDGDSFIDLGRFTVTNLG